MSFPFRYIKDQEVPTKVMENFNRKYPASENSIWLQRASNEWQVMFINNEKNKISKFDGSASWLKTTEILEYSKVPINLKVMVLFSFPDYTITQVQLLENQNGIFHCFVLKGTQQTFKVLAKDCGLNVTFKLMN